MFSPSIKIGGILFAFFIYFFILGNKQHAAIPIVQHINLFAILFGNFVNYTYLCINKTNEYGL